MGVLGLTFAPKGDQRRPKTIIVNAWQTTWVDFGGHLGPQKEPKIEEKQLFVVTFCRMRFFSMFSCIFDPSRPIFVDSWSCGEPFGYVKHRSKCTFPISDIFAIFGEFCSILSRFLTILTSFLVPKSPKIAKKRSKKEVEKRRISGVPGSPPGQVGGTSRSDSGP